MAEQPSNYLPGSLGNTAGLPPNARNHAATHTVLSTGGALEIPGRILLPRQRPDLEAASTVAFQGHIDPSAQLFGQGFPNPFSDGQRERKQRWQPSAPPPPPPDPIQPYNYRQPAAPPARPPAALSTQKSSEESTAKEKAPSKPPPENTAPPPPQAPPPPVRRAPSPKDTGVNANTMFKGACCAVLLCICVTLCNMGIGFGIVYGILKASGVDKMNSEMDDFDSHTMRTPDWDDDDRRRTPFWENPNYERTTPNWNG